MSNQSTIFCFSGTGNSLYAAKQLSVELGNAALVQITDEPPSVAVGGTGTKIGFVFPSYYLNLPRAVRAFIEKLDIKPDTYIFSIVTMGAAMGKGSVTAMKKALQAKGLKLGFGRGINMPDNYVLLYNPADPGVCEKALDKTDELLRGFAADIKASMHSVKGIPFMMNKLYRKTESLDALFSVTDSCTSCGLCEKICPVRNVRLENGRPEWLHHCEHCVACISWCPAKAIEYGSKTQSRRRYRNPRINADELTRKE